MIDDDRYCVDILLQISAVRAALQKVGLSLLRSHTHGCVATALREHGNEAIIEELIEVIDKFSK